MSNPQLEYETPSTDRTPISIKHVVGGTFASLAGGPGVVFAATMIAEVLSDDPYGALGGLLIGAMIGGLFLLIALIFGIAQCRSPSGRRRGFAIGLIIGSGLSLLGAGACFAAIRQSAGIV